MGTLPAAQLESLAQRYGTPLYVYDVAAVRRRHDRLLRELRCRPLRVFYSAKANPAVGLVAEFHRMGVGLDACSPGDLRLADLAGVPGSQISYTGFGATVEELLDVAEKAGDLVLERAAEVDLLARHGIRRPIGLRVNPEISAGFHAHVTAGAADAKFGLRLDDVIPTAELAASAGLPVVGLHAHLGSDVLDSEPHRRLLRTLADLAAALPEVRWINIGGGFGTPRRGGTPAYPWGELSAAAEAAATLPDGRQLELRVEPGAYLMMDVGIVLARVLAVDEQRSMLVVDASTNHLVSVLLYDAHHPVAATATRAGFPQKPFRVVGNLMQAGDVLARDVPLHAPHTGDLLTFGHAGAYAASRATTFNERPRPAEVMVDGDRAALLRRAETIDDLFSRDVQRS